MNIDAKRSGVLLILVLAAASGLRLFHLGQRVVWFDEANSLLVARATPAEIVDAARDDVHSALYYLILHVWQFVATWRNRRANVIRVRRRGGRGCGVLLGHSVGGR